MFPLRDNIPSRTFPWVMAVLIALNVLAFLVELTLSPDRLDALVSEWGIMPARFAPDQLRENGPATAATLLTGMFLHGGWIHLLGNMWFLWIFADNVEDRMGHGRFLLFYVLCGLAASGAQIAAGWGSEVPMIGASGAIAGVLGAYVVLYPQARILTLVPLFVLFFFVELPALVVLGLWFVLQALRGVAGLAAPSLAGGVAWWAHIGGFVAGVVLVRLFARRHRAPPRGTVVIWRA